MEEITTNEIIDDILFDRFWSKEKDRRNKPREPFTEEAYRLTRQLNGIRTPNVAP